MSGKGSGKQTDDGGQKDVQEGKADMAPVRFNKKRGREYPCAECACSSGHREMITSRRPKHARVKDEAPASMDADTVNDAQGKTTFQFLKICPVCEGEERRREGRTGVGVDEIKKEIHRINRGDQWGARGKFYHAARDVVSGLSDPMSKAERAKKVTETSRQMARESLSVLQKEGLMTTFADAGRKIKRAMEQWVLIDKLGCELDQAGSDAVECERLSNALSEAEATWEELHEYTTFKDKGVLQYRCIRAQDYDDRISSDLSRFYACPRCGTYFFSKFWHHQFNHWYFRLDWNEWCRDADQEDVDKLKKAWGVSSENWPVVGCTRIYQPFAYGHGMVVEYCDAGQWKCFRADLIPEILDDAIKGKQAEFNLAFQAMSPEQIWDLIPRVYPKANPVPLAGFAVFPGLGRFDLERWAAEDSPVLTSVGWLKVAVLVSENNMADLSHVFETAQTELKKQGISFVPSGKSDAVGDLLMAVRQ